MSKTILYVEDSMEKARRVNVLLKAAGYTVIHAGTLSRAAEIAHRDHEQISLVLSDTDLGPSQYGYTNIEIYRSYNFHIIGSSGESVFRHDWTDRGVADFFTKREGDSEMPAVIARINELLEGGS